LVQEQQKEQEGIKSQQVLEPTVFVLHGVKKFRSSVPLAGVGKKNKHALSRIFTSSLAISAPFV
jgi:hypothetical protein